LPSGSVPDYRRAMHRSASPPRRPAAPAAAATRPIGRKLFLRLTASALAGAALSGGLRRRARADAETVSVPAPQRPWESVAFTFSGASRDLPGIAVRLPAAAGGGIYAACTICPHQGCSLGLEADYETVGGIIGRDLDHPVFFCRCHFSTFDPAQNGNVIYGPSARPPWAFNVVEEGGQMTVMGVEPGAGEFG
jgi:Rieske Fe-S protein